MFNIILDFFKNLFNKKQPIDLQKEKIIVPTLSLKINTKNSLPWQYIVLHHSETKSGEVKTWDEIKTYHMSWRYNDEIITKTKALKLISEGKEVIQPWSDIGYNFGIATTGVNRFEYLIGRPLSKSGAHTTGFNNIGIGICILGSFNQTIPTVELYKFTSILVKELQRLFKIPTEKVIGHRESYDILKVPRTKTCPGAQIDLNYFRQKILG